MRVLTGEGVVSAGGCTGSVGFISAFGRCVVGRGDVLLVLALLCYRMTSFTRGAGVGSCIRVRVAPSRSS